MDQIQDTLSLITISAELRASRSFSLSFTCATCGHYISVIIGHAKDGIELLSSPTDSRPLSLSRCRLVVAQTEKGSLSISCGVCRSGRSILRVWRIKDGISYSSENCSPNTKRAAMSVCASLAAREHLYSRVAYSVEELERIIREAL